MPFAEEHISDGKALRLPVFYVRGTLPLNHQAYHYQSDFRTDPMFIGVFARE